jgi:homoserine dehydrogenase
MKPVKIGLLGLGTVGCGTVSVLGRNGDEIARRAGRGIAVVAAAVRDLSRPRDCELNGVRLTDDPASVVDDPEVEVVVELMGGTEPSRALGIARDRGRQARGDREQGPDRSARQRNLRPRPRQGRDGRLRGRGRRRDSDHQGTAGGARGQPHRLGRRHHNGTGNFILTEMRDHGRDFGDVLAEAQRLGYAEADPTFDVEGIDAAHKLCILAAIAFGIPLQFERIHIEGITGITREDVTFAGELGYRIKHLGIARRAAGGFELRVHPTLIPERRLIANVDGVMNAVLVQGDAVGPTLYYGAGAGAEATASAVVADLVDVVRALTADPENRVPHLAFQPGALSDLPILAMAEVRTSFYLRLRTQDRPGVLADITRVFGAHCISIEAILQREPDPERGEATIIILTHQVREGDMNEAIIELEKLPHLTSPVTRIRTEPLSR